MKTKIVMYAQYYKILLKTTDALFCNSLMLFDVFLGFLQPMMKIVSSVSLVNVEVKTTQYIHT